MCPLMYMASILSILSILLLILCFIEHFFEMKKPQCKEAVECYRKFLTRQHGVTKFLSIAEVTYAIIVDLLIIFSFLHFLTSPSPSLFSLSSSLSLSLSPLPLSLRMLEWTKRNTLISDKYQRTFFPLLSNISKKWTPFVKQQTPNNPGNQ